MIEFRQKDFTSLEVARRKVGQKLKGFNKTTDKVANKIKKPVGRAVQVGVSVGLPAASYLKGGAANGLSMAAVSVPMGVFAKPIGESAVEHGAGLVKEGVKELGAIGHAAKKTRQQKRLIAKNNRQGLLNSIKNSERSHTLSRFDDLAFN